MPGKSLDDFEVGQWVGIAFDSSIKGKVGKIVAFEESSIHVALYDKHGELIPGTCENHKIHKSSCSWSYPSSLYTPKETEEILYHCSYCGEEGHNRRTCPVENLTYMEENVKVVEYIKGEQIDDNSSLQKGTLVKTEKAFGKSSDDSWEAATYEVLDTNEYTIRCKVIDNPKGGGVGNFGKEWNFPVSEWIFFDATPMEDGVEKAKELSLWDLIETVLPASRLTLLWGPPGTGKTTIANSFGSPNYVSNITLTEETPAAELRGHFVPKGGEFVWMHGPALTEFKRGGRLVLNEIDKASGDALTFCHALLDDPGIARITLPFTDESGDPVTLKPHEDFHVVATMNGEPEDLPEALRDRFAVRIHVDQVHPNAIKRLPEDLHKIARKGISKDGDRSVSIRGWNAFVQLREMIGEENAARAVFGSRAKTILNTIKVDNLGAKK